MSNPAADAFAQARARYHAGDLAAAEHLCRQLLQADPRHASAWHLLGAALLAAGRPADAAEPLANALRLHPGFADAHLDRGRALADLGRRGEALAHFRQAAALRPGWFEALTQLGIALAQAGQLDDALAQLRAAAVARPDAAQAHHNLGVALAQAGRPADAADALRHALALQPDYAEAHYNLGTVLGTLGRRDEARASYHQALRLRPDYAEAYNNLGLALAEAGRPAEAAVFLRQALRLRPDLVEGHNNLGLALEELGRFAEAEAAYAEALRLRPRYAEAHGNLANAYKAQGRLDEALAAYQVALWLQPDAVSVRYNRSLALLQAGAYDEGWREYEWRWRRPGTQPRLSTDRPPWDGSPLDGRTILLWCEQGLGDAMQFARYAPLVQARGGRVLLQCPDLLVPLFRTLPGVAGLVAEGAPLPPFDCHAPLMSLPRLVGTTTATVPADVPYLRPNPALVERWRPRLAVVRGLRVGVAWQGNPHHKWDRHRSVTLAAFAPLAAVPGVRLVSLQRGPGAEQLAALRGRFAVLDLGDDLATLDDTAAVMAHLDLVVTVDTATAHLAGALAAPAWVLLAARVDWRWLLDREDSPWYPTLRLFRQPAFGDWAPVFARVAEELARRPAGPPQGE
jgi:tetratricopeptide (TPR) repeat protein